MAVRHYGDLPKKIPEGYDIVQQFDGGYILFTQAEFEDPNTVITDADPSP